MILECYMVLDFGIDETEGLGNMEVTMIPNMRGKKKLGFFFYSATVTYTSAKGHLCLKKNTYIGYLFADFSCSTQVLKMSVLKKLSCLLVYSSVMILLNSQNVGTSWLLHLETRNLKPFFFSSPLDFQLNSHLSTLANIHKIYHTLNRLVMTCHFILAK